jgi:hypothetical protein
MHRIGEALFQLPFGLIGRGHANARAQQQNDRMADSVN